MSRGPIPIELLLSIDRSRATALHAQIAEGVRAGIRAGRLVPGMRLPATRELARGLGVSRGVTVEAYAQLAAEGYLATRRGAGTVVAELAVARPAGDAAVGRAAAAWPAGNAGIGRASVGTGVARLARNAGDVGVGRADGGQPAGDAEPDSPWRTGAPRPAVPSATPAPTDAAPRIACHFHPGLPDLAAFPRAAWQRSLRVALRTSPDAALGYVSPAGTEALRESLARYLGRARGVAVDPEHVIVTNGATQGLALACRLLRARGARRIALEDPGFLEHRRVVLHHGLDAVPVPVDDQGLRTADLDRLDADAVLVTPAHHAPLGVVLAPERRAQLLAWARRRDALVIEDDYDAEFRYDRDPIGALQGLAPESVVYSGSASKVLAPGLRLGWLVAPAALAAPLAYEKRLDDVGTSVLDQLALADFLERGELDRHLRRMRPRYRARRDALAAALGARLPEVRLGGVAAGVHAVAQFPWETDEGGLVAAARQRGVVVHPLREHRFHTRSGPPGLWLGFGSLPPEAIERGVALIAEAYAEVAAPIRSGAASASAAAR